MRARLFGGVLYLRIQLVVPSNSLGVRMFVRDATEAAQYALLKKRKNTDVGEQEVDSHT